MFDMSNPPPPHRSAPCVATPIMNSLTVRQMILYVTESAHGRRHEVRQQHTQGSNEVEHVRAMLPLYLLNDSDIEQPTINKKKGITKSASVISSHGLWFTLGSQSPTLSTKIIKHTVMPRTASSEPSRPTGERCLGEITAIGVPPGERATWPGGTTLGGVPRCCAWLRSCDRAGDALRSGASPMSSGAEELSLSMGNHAPQHVLCAAGAASAGGL
eukprot:COSAG02_NODE_1015_length_15191_cov_6.937450_16_plen_215_part_00